MIREDKTHQIYSAMQLGQSTHGMVTLNQSLVSLVLAGEIKREQAEQYSYDIEELNSLLKKHEASKMTRKAASQPG